MEVTPALSGQYPLVVIAGPTASGKSALGIFLARELGGEVLACDSTQVYRGFTIGTGKVTPEEAGDVPHHLMDLCDPSEVFTAGDYMVVARQTLDEVTARGRLPIVTAGTGLYLRALLEGLSPLPKRSEELRARLLAREEERGAAYLHELLSRIDPESASEIASQDGSKLVRALEICFLARKPRSEFFRGGRNPLAGYRVLKFCLRPGREALYQRIESRVEKMMEAGGLEETRRLLENYCSDIKAFGFLGYKQLAAHLRGDCSLEEAVAQTKHGTRQYAKRQLTWFRRETGAEWFDSFGDEPEVQRRALGKVIEWMSNSRAK